jgi:hypothetical protein
MNYTKLVFEAKDVKSFLKDINSIVMADSKAKQLVMNFKRDEDKMVDLIDYLMVKYEKQIDNMMKNYNIGYDEAIDLIVKGI